MGEHDWLKVAREGTEVRVTDLRGLMPNDVFYANQQRAICAGSNPSTRFLDFVTVDEDSAKLHKVPYIHAGMVDGNLGTVKQLSAYVDLTYPPSSGLFEIYRSMLGERK